MNLAEPNPRGHNIRNGVFSNNHKPAIVFDFGGVLLDWNPRRIFGKFFDGDTEAMEKFFAEVDFFNWNYLQDRGRSFAEGVTEISRRFPQYAAYFREYDERWEESFTGAIQPTVDTLQPLKDKGHKLYALTNWSAEKYDLVEDKFEFLKLFESILVSGKVHVAKPEHRFYEMMLERIGRPARECVFIDDSLPNITAARNLGFQTIHFKSTPQMLFEMEQMGISLVKDFN